MPLQQSVIKYLYLFLPVFYELHPPVPLQHTTITWVLFKRWIQRQYKPIHFQYERIPGQWWVTKMATILQTTFLNENHHNCLKFRIKFIHFVLVQGAILTHSFQCINFLWPRNYGNIDMVRHYMNQYWHLRPRNSSNVLDSKSLRALRFFSMIAFQNLVAFWIKIAQMLKTMIASQAMIYGISCSPSPFLIELAIAIGLLGISSPASH